jgi:hypothetical protein
MPGKHVNALVSDNSSSISTSCGETALDDTLETVAAGVMTGGGLACGTWMISWMFLV